MQYGVSILQDILGGRISGQLLFPREKDEWAERGQCCWAKKTHAAVHTPFCGEMLSIFAQAPVALQGARRRSVDPGSSSGSVGYSIYSGLVAASTKKTSPVLFFLFPS